MEFSTRDHQKRLYLWIICVVCIICVIWIMYVIQKGTLTRASIHGLSVLCV